MSEQKRWRHGEVFEVEELRAQRTRQGQVQYFVKWQDYSEQHNSWEPALHILDKDLIDALEQRSAPWTWQFYVATPIDGLGVGWHGFTDNEGISVSAAYQAWLDEVPGAPSSILFSRTLPGKREYRYVLDFGRMVQRNETHRDHTVRFLRRV